MFMNTVLNIIGSMRISIFVSSTCVNVHSLQGPCEVVVVESLVLLIIAARSKKL